MPPRTFIDAIRETLADEMRRDPTVIVLGEDVGKKGGVFLATDGLWAECVCETPMEHWGLGLEAFGVRLDEPGDAYRGEIGERLPVGLDLEWEAATPVYDYPYPDETRTAHYEHAGIVPDVMTLAKALAGGLPIGATLTTARVAAAGGSLGRRGSAA